MKKYRNHSDAAVVKARRFRREMSVSEEWMWARLRNDKTGFRFRRQVPVGPYFLDFFCPEAKLCVEVDGEQHSLSEAKDAARDRFLSEHDIMVLRIPSQDIFDSENCELLCWWIESIVQHCVERTGKIESEKLKRQEWYETL